MIAQGFTGVKDNGFMTFKSGGPRASFSTTTTMTTTADDNWQEPASAELALSDKGNLCSELPEGLVEVIGTSGDGTETQGWMQSGWHSGDEVTAQVAMQNDDDWCTCIHVATCVV